MRRVLEGVRISNTEAQRHKDPERIFHHLRVLLIFILVSLLVTGCNLRAGNATNTPLPTPDIPRIQFTYPDNNSTVLENTDMQIDLLAEDSGAGVARVELLIDDLKANEARPEVSNEVPTFTVRMNWVTKGAGIHSLTAIAYRLDGVASAPTTILVQVLPRPTPQS